MCYRNKASRARGAWVFKLTRYLGGNRYESTCIKCRERVLWADGDDIGMVVFQNEDIGLLCPKCYKWTKAAHCHCPNRSAG
jgi:hypothetical protein